MARTTKVTVVDYGGSNLLSVVRALRHCQAEIALAENAAAVHEADRLVLPGVGAFGDVRAALERRDLLEPIRSFAASGRPFLGICVGMQLMMEYGEEFGRHEGLGLVPGGVEALPRTDVQGRPHRIPHIGWRELVPAGNEASRWDGTFLSGSHGSSVYFVHSFQALPRDDRFRLADCYYGGIRIAAAIARDNLFGCQFHPEKSGPAGLAMLQRFVAA